MSVLLVSKRVIYALENPSESPIFYTARSTTQFEVKIDTTYSFGFNSVPSIVFTVGSNSQVIEHVTVPTQHFSFYYCIDVVHCPAAVVFCEHRRCVSCVAAR